MPEYIVGRNSTFSQIQDAVDAVLDATGGSTFTEEHKIILQDTGIYGPLDIPSGMTPTDTYRLVVTGQQGTFPSIVGSLDYDKGYVAATIAANYVTVTNLRLRNAVRGIVVSGSDFILGNCYVCYCSRGGVYAWEADNFYGYNLNIHHVAYGIVGWKSDDLALFHSNIMMTSDPSYVAKSCLYLRRKDGTGSPTFQLRNNNLVAYSGSLLNLHNPVRIVDADVLDSDYNNLYTTSGVLVNTAEGEIYAASLVEWKRKSSQDAHSIGSDPVFVNREIGNDSFDKIYVDMNLLSSSPLKEKGEDTQSGSYLSNVDTSVLASDILGSNRSSSPTIGPHEVVVTSSYYGQDIFHVYASGTDPCADSKSILDIALDNYGRTVSQWNPMVRSGYFYVRDNQYYLYSDKQAKTLGSITWSFFDLSATLINGKTFVQFDGKWLDDKYWNIHGDTLILKHKDLNIVNLDEQVRVVGVHNVWNETTKTFDANTGDYLYVMEDGQQRYFLDPAPVNGAPVVMTDDTISQLEWTGDLPHHFYMTYDEEYNQTELVLGVTNIARNPIFADYNNNDTVDHWYTLATVATGQILDGEIVHPNYGYQYLNAESGDIVRQDISGFSPLSTYYCRVNAFPVDAGATMSMGIDFYESDGTLITGEDTTFTVDGWSAQSTFIPPSNAGIALFKVWSDYNIGLEAVQIDTSPSLKFSKLPRLDSMTVEWEGSDKGAYVVNDLTLNPITNPYTNGFLCIPNIPASQFDDEAATGTSTLLDWGWQHGRLSHLPWAKTEGKNKWSTITHEQPYEMADMVSYSAPTAHPSGILIAPDQLFTVQSSTGDELYFQVFDREGNTMAHYPYTASLWDTTGEFPGYMGVREFGFYTNVGQQIKGETNSAGGGSVRIVPVDQEYIQHSNPKLYSAFGTTGEPVYYFSTKYEVSDINHGNPTITGPDGVKVTMTGDVISSLRPTYPNGDFYEASLTDYPYRGTVQAWDDGGLRLLEVFHDTPGLGEFSVSYENRVITTKSSGPITLQYSPRILWKDPRYTRRVYMSTRATLPTYYTLDYDAQVWFAVHMFDDDVSKWLKSKVVYLNPEALEER